MVHRIAVIPGDGVGPEIMREGLKVLKTLEGLGYGSYEFTEFPYGANHYVQFGAPMPEDALAKLREFDAIYFGAHGNPALIPDSVSAQGTIHRIRKAFDQYVNLRPIRLFPGVVSPLRDKTDIDFVVVRENSEGEYSGVGGRLHVGTPEEMATQVMIITRKGAERVMRFAFEQARKRNRMKKVTAATKANALSHSMPLWDEVFDGVAGDYPDIETEKINVDAFTMHLIKRPESFDVIVATNMMGDILSDEGAAIAGGVGLCGGGNLDPERRHPSLFEPIHGSAPKYAGKNTINPIATIQAGRLMLEWLGEDRAAQLVGQAIEDVLAEGRIQTRDLGGRATTSEMGGAICQVLGDRGPVCTQRDL